MKRDSFYLSPLPVLFLIASLALPPQSAYALRSPSTKESAGLKQLTAGLEESLRAVLSGPQNRIVSVAISPSSKQVIAGTDAPDYQLHRWNISSVDSQSKSDKAGLNSVIAYQPDGKNLVTGNKLGALFGWNAEYGSQLWKKTSRDTGGHQAAILAIRMARNGSDVVVADQAGVVKQWTVSSGNSQNSTNIPQMANTTHLDLLDERMLLFVQKEQVSIWTRDDASAPFKEFRKLNKKGVVQAFFHPNGQSVVTVDKVGVIEQWNISDTKLMGTFRNGSQPPQQILWNGTGDQLIGVTSAGEIIFWNTLTQQKVESVKNPSGGVVAITTDRYGRSLVVAGSDNQVRLWNLPNPLPADLSEIEIVQPDRSTKASDFEILEFLEAHSSDFLEGFSKVWGTNEPFQRERLKKWILRYRNVSESPLVERVLDVLQNLSDSRWVSENQQPVRDLFILPLAQLGSFWKLPTPEEPEYFAISLELLQQADLRLLLYLLETGDEAPLRDWAAEQVKPSKSALDDVLGKEPTKQKPKVIAAPKITKQPASVSFTEGGNAAFSIEADGKELKYQWYRNNKPIDGETEKTLVIRNVKPSDAGTIHAEISNPGGTVSSNEVQLIVAAAPRTVKAAPPEITSKPKDVTLVRNRSGQIEQDAVFSVTAKGEGVSYQWQFQEEDGGYKPINGATESTYTIPADELTKERAGRYRVVITNAGGQVMASVTLTLKDPPLPPKPPPSSTSGSASAAVSAPVSAVAREVQHQIAQAAQRSTQKGLGSNRLEADTVSLAGHEIVIGMNVSGQKTVRVQLLPFQNSYLGVRTYSVFFPDPALTGFPAPAWVSSFNVEEVLNTERKNGPMNKLRNSTEAVQTAREEKKPIAEWLPAERTTQIQNDLRQTMPLPGDNGKPVADYLDWWVSQGDEAQQSVRRKLLEQIAQVMAEEIGWMHRLAAYRQKWEGMADANNAVSLSVVEQDLTEIEQGLSRFPDVARLARDLRIDAARNGKPLSVDPLWRLTNRIADRLRWHRGWRLIDAGNSENLSGSYYLAVGLALQRDYQRMAANPGQDTSWHWAGMADMLLCWSREYAITLTARSNAKAETSRTVSSVIDPAGGVLWLDPDGQPVRFDEGAGAVKLLNGWALFFHPAVYGQWRQSSDEQPVLVVNTLTGMPSVEQLNEYAVLLETLARETPHEEIPWLAAVHAETGEIRILKPAHLPSDADAWGRFRDSLGPAVDRGVNFNNQLARQVGPHATHLLEGKLFSHGRLPMTGATGLGSPIPDKARLRSGMRDVVQREAGQAHTLLVAGLSGLLKKTLTALYSNGGESVIGWVIRNMRDPIASVQQISVGNLAERADSEILPVLKRSVELVSERESAPIVSNPDFFELVEVPGFSETSFPDEMDPWLVSRGVSVPVDPATQRIQREISQAARNSTQLGLRPNRFLSDSGGLIGQRLVMGVNMAGNTGYRAHMVPWNISPLGGRVYTSLFPDPNMDDSPFPHTAWVAFFEIRDFLGLERKSRQGRALINSLDKIGQAQKAGKPMDQWISPDLPKEIQQNASEMFLETDAQDNKALIQVEKWLTGKSAMSRADKQQAIDEIAAVLNNEIAVMHRLAALRTEWQKIASGNNQRVPFSRVEEDLKPILDDFQQMPIAREMLEGLLSVFRQQGESVSVQDLWFVPYRVADQLRAYRLWRFMPRVPAQVLSEIYYAVVWMNYERHLRVMEENPGNYSDWDWVGMADTILSLYREHLMSEAAAQRAQPFPTRRIAQVLDPIGGVLFLDKNGKPLRFEEGAGAVKSINNPGVQFNPVAYQSNPLNPDEQPVLVINSLTGLPAVEHLDMYFSLIKDMQAAMPDQKIPWLAVAHSETGQVRLFKPLHLPGESEGWNQFNEALDGAAVRSAAFQSGVRAEVAEPVKTYDAEAQRARDLQEREDARRRGAGFTSMTKAITDAAKEAAYQKLVPGLPGLVERNLSAAYDQSPGERSPWLLGRLAEGFERVRTEVTLDTMNTKPEDVIPPVLREAEILVAETEGASLLSNPKFFEPVSIPGLTTDELPEEMDPWLAGSEQRIPGERFATLPALEKRLTTIAKQVQGGETLLPNQIMLDERQNLVAVDVTESAGRTFQLVSIGLFRVDQDIMPFLPTSAWLGDSQPVPTRYVAELSDSELTPLDAAESHHPGFSRFSDQMKDLLAEILKLRGEGASDDRVILLLNQMAELERTVLEGRALPGAGGRSSAERIEDLKGRYPDQADAIDEAVRLVRTGALAYLEWFRRYDRAWDNVQGEKSSGDFISAEEIRKAVSELLEYAECWPDIHRFIEVALSQLPADNPAIVSRADWLAQMKEWGTLARSVAFEPAWGSLPAGVLQAVYYDAIRLALSDSVPNSLTHLQSSVSPDPVLRVMEELWSVAELIKATEIEAALTHHIHATARPIVDSKVFPKKMSQSSLGALFIAPDGAYRLIPGGGSFVRDGAAGATYNSAALREWMRPGDQVVLLCACWSSRGIPRSQQQRQTVLDLPGLRRILPGGASILLGAVTPKGKLRLYEPAAVEDDQTLPQSDLLAVNQVSRARQFSRDLRSAADITQGNSAGEAWRQRVIHVLTHFAIPASEEGILGSMLNRYAPETAEQARRDIRALFPDMFSKWEELSYLSASHVTLTDRSMASKEKTMQKRFVSAQAEFKGVIERIIDIALEWIEAPAIEKGVLFREIPVPSPASSGSPKGAVDVEVVLKRLIDQAVDKQGWNQAEVEAFSLEWRVEEGIEGRLAQDAVKQSDFNKALRGWLTRKDAADAATAKKNAENAAVTAKQLAAATQRGLETKKANDVANQKTADTVVAELIKIIPSDLPAVVSALSAASATAQNLSGGQFALRVVDAIQNLSQQAVDALKARVIDVHSPEAVQASLSDLEKLSAAVSAAAGDGKWTETLAETKTAWVAAGPAAAVKEIQQLYDQLFQPEPPPIEADAVERWQKWTTALPPELPSTRETLQQLRVIRFYERLPYLPDIVAEGAAQGDAFLREAVAIGKELPDSERNWALMHLGSYALGVVDSIAKLPVETDDDRKEQQQRRVTYLPLFDGIVALMLDQLKGTDNIILQWHSAMREHRYNMQHAVETTARHTAIDRANAADDGRLANIRSQPLSVGQELVFTHKHSGRQIRFLFDQIKRPATGVEVAVFKTRTPPGQVILPVNKLKHAQQSKDERNTGNGWRDGGISVFLRKHDQEMHGVFGPVSFEMDSRIDRRQEFLNSLFWVFPFELVADVSRPDSGVTLEHRPSESNDAKVLVDYYPNLALRTVPSRAGSGSSDKVTVQIDDSLDLWKSEVVKPAAGLEETIPARVLRSSYGQGDKSFRERQIGTADRPLGPNRNISLMHTVDMQELVVALSGGAGYTGPEWVQVPLQTPPLHPFVPTPLELNREQYSVRVNLREFYQMVSAGNRHYLPLFGLLSQERTTKEFTAGGAELKTWASETIAAARALLTHTQIAGDLQSRLYTWRQEFGDTFTKMEQESQRQESLYVDYFSQLRRIETELKALAGAAQSVTHRQAEEKLQALVPFLAPWPDLQLSLKAFLWGLHPAPPNKISIDALQNQLAPLSEGVRQAIRVQVSRQASFPRMAFTVYDLTRLAVLERLKKLEQQINLAEADDASLNDWAQEVVTYSHRALDLESEQIFTELVYREVPQSEAVARIPDFPVQGGGLLLLDSKGRQKDFVEGMGVSIDENLAPRYSSGRAIDWLKARYAPGDRVVVIYPSSRGRLTLEQLSGFLNDLAAFRQQLNPAVEVWMAAVVDGVGEHPASFGLYRPNIPSENWEPGWMILRSTVETRALGLTNLIESFYANGLMERINHNIRHYYEISQQGTGGADPQTQNALEITRVTGLIRDDLTELSKQLYAGFGAAYGLSAVTQAQDLMEGYLKSQFFYLQKAGPDEINRRFPALFRWMDEFLQEFLAVSVITNPNLFSPAYIDGLTDMEEVDKQVRKLVDLRGRIKPVAPSEEELPPFARWWVVDQYNSGKSADHKGFPAVWNAFVKQRNELEPLVARLLAGESTVDNREEEIQAIAAGQAMLPKLEPERAARLKEPLEQLQSRRKKTDVFNAVVISGRQFLESQNVSLDWLGEVHDFLDEALAAVPQIEGDSDKLTSLTALAQNVSDHAYDLLLQRAESLLAGDPEIDRLNEQLEWMGLATDLFIDQSYDDLVGEKWRGDNGHAQRYKQANHQVWTQREDQPLAEYTQVVREHGVELAQGETLVIRLPWLPGSSEPREIEVHYQGPVVGSGSDGRAQFEISYPADQALAPGRLMGAQVDHLEVAPLGTFVADVREAAVSPAPDLPRLLKTVMQPPIDNPKTVSERLQSRAVFYPFSDLARLLGEDPFRPGLAVNGNLTKMFDQAPLEIVLQKHDHEGEVVSLSVVEREGAPRLLFYVLAAGQEEKNSPTGAEERTLTVQELINGKVLFSPGDELILHLSFSSEPTTPTEVVIRYLGRSDSSARFEVTAPNEMVLINGNLLHETELHLSGSWKKIFDQQIDSRQQQGKNRQGITLELSRPAEQNPNNRKKLGFGTREGLSDKTKNISADLGGLASLLTQILVFNLYQFPKESSSTVEARFSHQLSRHMVGSALFRPAAISVSATRVRESSPASLGPKTAKQRREDQDQAELKNEQVLTAGSSTSLSIANVLFSDRRFTPFLEKDEQNQAGPFLESVQKDQPDIHLAQELRSRLNRMDRSREGVHRKLFFDAVVRLVGSERLFQRGLVFKEEEDRQHSAAKQKAAVADDQPSADSSGLEETLPDELERATFSVGRVPVRILDLASDRPFFNAVYTAPDGRQVQGLVPIPRLFQDTGERMRVNQKSDRVMANGDEPILARVDLQGGELNFYPDLDMSALDNALNRLLDDLEGMVGFFPAVDLPAQVIKRVTGGKGAEVLYRLEDGSGRRGRGYLTVSGEQAGWLQRQIGREIRVTPIAVDRTRSERQVVFRPVGLPLSKSFLLEQKLLEKSVTLEEIQIFLDDQLVQDKQLPYRLINIYQYSHARVWRNLTRSSQLAVFRWLAGQSDSTDADLADRLFHLFDRAWKYPHYGRTSQAWILRGMAGAARDDAQRETARQSIEIWFRWAPFPEPEHAAILDPVVYELFGWPQDAYALSLDVRARSTAGLEEETTLTAADLMSRRELFPGDELRLRLAMTPGATAGDLVIRYLGRGEGSNPGARFEVTLPDWMEMANGNSLQDLAVDPDNSWRHHLWDLLQGPQQPRTNPSPVLLGLSRPLEKNPNNRTKLGFGTLDNIRERARQAKGSTSGLSQMLLSMPTLNLYDLPEGSAAAVVHFSNRLNRVDLKSAVLRRAGRQTTAGLEEARSMLIDRFEHQQAFSSAEHQQIEGAKNDPDGPARYAITVPLPRSFTVYVQQDRSNRLLFSVEQSLYPPAGVQMAVEPISDQIKDWDEMGYVLENAGLGEPAYNPEKLPFRRVWSSEVSNINPLELLAEIWARRLKLSDKAVVGQMLYQDSDGARLVLFSKEA